VRAGNVARDNRARAPGLLPAHGELRRKPQRRQLVEFTLTPEGDERTRLRVVESGHELLAWPDAEKQRYADEHRDGWVDYLDRLAALLTKRQPE